MNTYKRKTTLIYGSGVPYMNIKTYAYYEKSTITILMQHYKSKDCTFFLIQVNITLRLRYENIY